MRKLIVSTWLTLDGIFDAESMGQWFNPYDSQARQDIIREGILSADAIVFGRKTYEMLAPYWSSLKNNEMGVAAKLNSVEKYVVSTTLKEATWEHSTIIRDNIEQEIARLKQQPGKEIQIEGSAALVQSLTKAGLIDEYQFLVHPVMMGGGKRFFGEGVQAGLQLTNSRQLDKGVMWLCYQPA
ncbi:dihydrofolate reductase family protein [Chitinophaga varians]|uniref:dihydrofolate reductase family protein n=1 Tax=Chitinophaga varians TaxID=2202339 RepID=UPI00165FDFB5|nr:dihydrofolate reductase family protein [Chitinophaga varians]MBC9913481.1 dihydrofolate reductase family protein [Chitinophaga varians]